jgi:hypothetical protein
MKLKRLAAAAAMAAAALPAMGNIAFPNTGNGEFVVVVVDRADGASYLLDLGLTMNDFNGAGSYSYTLGGANFDAFLAAASATSSTLEFAVFAGDSEGATASNPKRLFTTIDKAAGDLTNTPLGNTQLGTSTANLQTFLNYQLIDAPTQTHTTVENGDSWAAAGNNAYFLQFAGDTFNNQTAVGGWANTNALGTSAVFRSFSTSSTSGGAQNVKTDFAGTWSLSNSAGVYTLSYGGTAPIPEAEGVLMLMVGLSAMAFVGRRRRDR